MSQPNRKPAGSSRAQDPWMQVLDLGIVSAVPRGTRATVAQPEPGAAGFCTLP